MRSTMHVDRNEPDAGEQLSRFRRRVLERLATHGRRAAIGHAEPFKRMDDL
jgi:hypothetical protein